MSSSVFVALSEGEILKIIQAMKDEYAKPIPSCPKILKEFQPIACEFRVRWGKNYLVKAEVSFSILDPPRLSNNF